MRHRSARPNGFCTCATAKINAWLAGGNARAIGYIQHPTGNLESRNRFMSEVEIFSAEVCPFAQRTRMILIEKDVPFTLREVDLNDKPD
jgi:hypothetical protein